MFISEVINEVDADIFYNKHIRTDKHNTEKIKKMYSKKDLQHLYFVLFGSIHNNDTKDVILWKINQWYSNLDRALNM